jgi:hypothetical protein
MIKNRPLTATTLRLILVCSLFGITLLGTAAFTFIYRQLKVAATDTSHVVADAKASQNTLQTLKQVEQKLRDDKAVVERAGSIVADSQSYQYQNQVINDINDYASKAGIGITNIDFATTSTTPSTAPKSPLITPTGVAATSISVTLSNPVPYDNFLRFIHSIEQNLTKMQLTRVSLAKGTMGNDITSEALTIQVYLRKESP